MSKNQRLYKKWFKRVYGKRCYSKREFAITARKNRHIYDRMTRLAFQMEGKPMPRNAIKRGRRALNRLTACGLKNITEAMGYLREAMDCYSESAREIAS